MEAGFAFVEGEDFVDGHLVMGGWDIWYVRWWWRGCRGPGGEEGYYVEKEGDVVDESVGNGRCGVGLSIIMGIYHVFDRHDIS